MFRLGPCQTNMIQGKIYVNISGAASSNVLLCTLEPENQISLRAGSGNLPYWLLLRIHTYIVMDDVTPVSDLERIVPLNSTSRTRRLLQSLIFHFLLRAIYPLLSFSNLHLYYCKVHLCVFRNLALSSNKGLL